jgi:hypothetical protein
MTQKLGVALSCLFALSASATHGQGRPGGQGAGTPGQLPTAIVGRVSNGDGADRERVRDRPATVKFLSPSPHSVRSTNDMQRTAGWCPLRR